MERGMPNDADAALISSAPALLVERDRLKLQISELVAALQHMKICGSCGEDSWNICEGGRAAQAALDKADKQKCSADMHDWESMPQDAEGYDARCRKCGDRKET
jgi:hypothetical protein